MSKDEWQPIETAPKDGTPIIGYDCEASAEHRIFWDEYAQSWVYVEETMAYAFPDWWRPAPALPTVRPHYTEENSPPYDPDAPDNDAWSA